LVAERKFADTCAGRGILADRVVTFLKRGGSVIAFGKTLASALVGLITLGLGCSSADVVDTWRDPSLSGPVHFNRVLAIAVHPDGAVRRIAEDEMVKQIGTGRAVPGYQFIRDEERGNVPNLKKELSKGDFGGVVVMSVIGVRDQTRFVPAAGDSYEPFFLYYDHAHTASETPGYLVTEKIARIETRVYSVAKEKLIWSAVSDAFDPGDTRKTVRDVLKTVGAELRKQKLLD
jgi:hypothetical protein